MRKDNYGICLSFYAVLAFVLTIVGHTTLGFLLLGFVIVVHKDRWLTTQVMQAFFLSLVSGVFLEIISIFHMFDVIPYIGGIIVGFFNVISGLITLFTFVFAIVGIIKVSKGEEADLPIIKTFAERAFGIVKKVTYVQDEGNAGNVQNDENAQN